jgi:hypothetical protein
MMRDMHPRTIRKALLCAVLATATFGASGAQAQDEPGDLPDARLEGYRVGEAGVGRVAIEKPSGTALTWFALAGLGILGIGVMFKPGRRTHLD